MGRRATLEPVAAASFTSWTRRAIIRFFTASHLGTTGTNPAPDYCATMRAPFTGPLTKGERGIRASSSRLRRNKPVHPQGNKSNVRLYLDIGGNRAAKNSSAMDGGGHGRVRHTGDAARSGSRYGPGHCQT